MNEPMINISDTHKIKIADLKKKNKKKNSKEFVNHGKDTLIFTTRMSKQTRKSILRV